MKDFFVSYTQANRKWAEWIAWELEAAGYTTVIQAWDFRPGGNFVLDMHTALRETRYTIAVLSPEYLTAVYPQPEWAAVFASDPQGMQRRLKPVRVAECQPHGLLCALTYIDLVGVEKHEAARRLLEGIQIGRAKPTEAPQFPGGVQRSVPTEPEFPGTVARGGLLPRRPAVERVVDLANGQQVMVPVESIYVDGNRRCFVRRDAVCLSDDEERSDVIRLGSVRTGSDLILYLHTMRQEHQWEMDQRVGVGVTGFMPITFVNEELLRVLPERWDAFLQETMPARHLKFNLNDLMSQLEAGRYSIAPENVLVTGRYKDEVKYWLRRQGECRAGDELEIRVVKQPHNGPDGLTVSLANLEQHLVRLQRREAVDARVERDYVEIGMLPVLY